MELGREGGLRLGWASWRFCMFYTKCFLSESATNVSYSGVVQLFMLLGNLVLLAIPDRLHNIIGSWGKPGHIGARLLHWPTDFTRDILPIPCHSHNDYWRKVPLYSAIGVGCVGVEADIWLSKNELYIGHSIASLTPNRTLSSLYIDPLLNILSKQNPEPLVIPNRDQSLHGVFDTNPEQPVILLIDFKMSGTALFPHVVQALEPLRSMGYLTKCNGSELIHGPIIVVGTGEAPFEMVASDSDNLHHDIFFDAPLDDMYEGPDGETTPHASRELSASISSSSSLEKNDLRRYGSPADSDGKAAPVDAGVFTTLNSYYASTSLTNAIGTLSGGEFSDHQLNLLRGQIRGAHRRGLKARYWDLPSWPINLRNHVWDILVKEGVDLLNVDDLEGASKGDWAKHHGW